LIGQFNSGYVQHQKPILTPTINAIPASVPFTSIPAGPTITLPAQQQIVEPAVIRSVQNRQKNDEISPATSALTAVTTLRPLITTEPATSEELEEQNQNAHYNFKTSVLDTINDHEHVRQEVREGLALKGMYSYSDGFFRRTVHYEADEGGYRVTKEEIQPIGDGEGPKFNPNGQADVRSSLTGDYKITVDDFRLNKRQEEAKTAVEDKIFDINSRN
jgi:hypothetical protein